MYKVALFANNYPYRDYHWYRQDNYGFWSHKPGSNDVTCLDYDQNRILDPVDCNRKSIYEESLRYEVFIGYFAVLPLE